MVMIQSDIRSALQLASTFGHLNPNHQLSVARAVFSRCPLLPLRFPSAPVTPVRVRAFSSNESQVDRATVYKVPNKPPICSADELHYVSVNGSDWKIALWRYHISPQAPQRNHPLLLLSGVGTNAIGYDLSPESSFARYMSEQGFDTWILEVRGAGLSVEGSESKEIEQSAHAMSEQMEAAANSATAGVFSLSQRSTKVLSDTTESEMTVTEEDHPIGIPTVFDESKLVTKLTEIFMHLSERVSGFLSEGQSKIIFAKLFDQMSRFFEESFLSEPFNETRGKLLSLLETKPNSGVASQIRDLSQKLVNIINEGQRSVSPPLFDLQERFIRTVEHFQKQLELIVKYDWDFDHYLEEDVPAAMEYIKAQTKPRDGKLLAIGHSMGGILLYALLSRYGAEGSEPDLAAIVTLASSLDYRSSRSSLKLLLPFADPAQVLNVPAVPLGALLTVAFPLSSRPPYVLSWLNQMISAEDMMHPELLKKLVLNNFGTIPAKLLLQLASVFHEGGLCDRSGKFFYKDHLHKNNVPILAIAGDQDQICPTEAVYETVKIIPENLVTYKVFGKPEGPHYGHYDLVGGRQAVDQVYPCIIQFLSRHDLT